MHGTYANQYDFFARMAPELAWAGHCVYSFNCGVDSDAWGSVIGEGGLGTTFGEAGVDQLVGSDYLQRLNAEGDTVPGVNYTVVGTENDLVTTPYQSTFLEEGPGATVDNITLQDGCWIDRSGHLSMMYSPRALDPEGDGWLRCRYNSRVP